VTEPPERASSRQMASPVSEASRHFHPCHYTDDSSGVNRNGPSERKRLSETADRGADTSRGKGNVFEPTGWRVSSRTPNSLDRYNSRMTPRARNSPPALANQGCGGTWGS